MTRLQFHDPFWGYPSSQDHGSEKWVPPIVVRFQIQPFFTSMIMGERVVLHPALVPRANRTDEMEGGDIRPVDS